mmetsp:Transcript_18340/g.62382  ORF Transcript_18340/g.62382 Transcript_18340/m.62382 type:complete len:362 (+) Transcript_18340:2865-3950(+)
MKPAEATVLSGSALSSCSRLFTCSCQRSFSPPSLPSRPSAASSWSVAFFRPILSSSASLVRFANSVLSFITSWSRCFRSTSHCCSFCFDSSRLAFRSSRSRSSGAMRSRTMLNLTFAFTHAASGAAATETRYMFWCSKLLALELIRSCTDLRFAGVTRRASKLMISSFTAREARNFFMLCQEVSPWPMSRSTPSSTSRMASGGLFSARISLRLSDLICPTALRALSIRGWISESSSSMPFRRMFSSTSSVEIFFCCFSTSVLLSLALCIDVVICPSACSAWICFSSSSFFCEPACCESSSTFAAASASLLRPPCRNCFCSSCCVRFAAKICLYRPTKLTYSLGVALQVLWTYIIWSTMLSS